jgi:DNA invertase Pin-like site-specific DNA recombinase
MTKNRPDLNRRKPTYVYFARGLDSGLIKIGFSNNPEDRAGNLTAEVGEPVKVLFTILGGRQKESGFHLRFADHGAARGREWFHEAGALHQYLRRRGVAGIKTVYQKLLVEKVVELRPNLVLVRPTLAQIPDSIEPRLIGYARVSTEDQNLDMQIAMLKQAGVSTEDLFTDKLSAVNAKRPYFNLMMKHLYPGDTLLIYSISRLAREVRALFSILDDLKELGVTVKSLTEPHLDLTTPQGRMMMTITAAVDQNERERLQSRTKDGMAELKRQGMSLGRPRKVSKTDIEKMKKMRASGKGVGVIAKKFGIQPATVYAYTRERGDDASAA